VVCRAGHHLQQPPGHDHPTIGVADVLVRPEERAAVLSDLVEVGFQRTTTPGIGKEQVGIDAVGV